MAKAKPKNVIEDDVKNEETKALKSDEIDKAESDQESQDSQEISLRDDESETETKEEIAPEVSALNADNDTAKSANKQESKGNKSTKSKQSKQSKKAVQKKIKSKKYQETVKDFDKRKEFTIEDAIEQVKKLSYSKFDGTITLDIKLAKAKKEEEGIRGTIKLPNPTGKTQKVVVATDEIIEKIKKGETDFDILLATPQMMPRLAPVAKILGPKGKMPNPKDGSVVENTDDALKEIESTVRYRMDAGRNLHIAVGKVSTDSTKIAENVQAILKALAHLKKDSATLSPTMGPGVKISI